MLASRAIDRKDMIGGTRVMKTLDAEKGFLIKG